MVGNEELKPKIVLQEEKGTKKKPFSRGRLGSSRKGFHDQISALSVPALSFCVYNSIKAETEKTRHIQKRKTRLPSPSSSYHRERSMTRCTAARRAAY